MKVFDEDGRYVWVGPSPEDPQHDMLNWLRHASSTADGNMMIADVPSVCVFSRDGAFVKELKPPHVQGKSWGVYDMCTSPRGELVALQETRQIIRVLDADGALLWTAELRD